MKINPPIKLFCTGHNVIVSRHLGLSAGVWGLQDGRHNMAGVSGVWTVPARIRRGNGHQVWRAVPSGATDWQRSADLWSLQSSFWHSASHSVVWSVWCAPQHLSLLVPLPPQEIPRRTRHENGESQRESPCFARCCVCMCTSPLDRRLRK